MPNISSSAHHKINPVKLFKESPISKIESEAVPIGMNARRDYLKDEIKQKYNKTQITA